MHKKNSKQHLVIQDNCILGTVPNSVELKGSNALTDQIENLVLPNHGCHGICRHGVT